MGLIDKCKKAMVVGIELNKVKDFAQKANEHYTDEVLFDAYMNKAHDHLDKAMATYHGYNN